MASKKNTLKDIPTLREIGGLKHRWIQDVDKSALGTTPDGRLCQNFPEGMGLDPKEFPEGAVEDRPRGIEDLAQNQRAHNSFVKHTIADRERAGFVGIWVPDELAN